MSVKKKQINIRITNNKNFDLYSEWESKFINGETESSKNKSLENLLFKAILKEKLKPETDFISEKIQIIFEKNVNKILKRVFGRQDLITLNLIKYLRIDEIKFNYLLSALYEAGIIKDATFTEPHKQQIIDMPWVRNQKNNLDSEFAYIQKTEIIKDFGSIGKDSYSLQGELQEEINKTVEKLNAKSNKLIKKHNIKIGLKNQKKEEK